MRKIIFAILCVLSLNAQAQKTDTAKKNVGDTIKKDLLTAPDTVKKLHSRATAFIAPAGLIVYGALSFEVGAIRRLDYSIHDNIERRAPKFNTKAESYFQFAPVAMVYGLNLIGVSGKNTFIDRTALLGLSAGFVSISTFAVKHATHRLRPNGADHYSFPSGHTATAFAGAEFLAQEYSSKSPVYTVIGYTFAITTGVFRMYNRDHWFSDVVAGAGFGILSTKAAYLVYPYLRNALTHTSKDGKHTLVMPMYQDGVAGFAFTKQL